MKKFNRDSIEYYGLMIFIYTLMFGGIFLSGWISGVNWSEYGVDFSWSMLNTEELKAIIGMN
ncbi:hypothetical protein [Halobacillus litoralis]|uniref:hypothetical protein n=1 Tax=Halobacillus litoralis TaxID=45668 RepID=UPI001CFE36D9|nr:hypothetical protein [Halobacillus litoralis]